MHPAAAAFPMEVVLAFGLAVDFPRSSPAFFRAFCPPCHRDGMRSHHRRATNRMDDDSLRTKLLESAG